MQVLDTSITNVALPHMQGSLSTSVEETSWVITSYLAANAIVIPATAWLTGVLGRRRLFLICTILFTVTPDQLRGRLDVANHNSAVVGLGSPVARVGHEVDLGCGAERLQRVRPGALRLAVEKGLRLVRLVRARLVGPSMRLHDLGVDDAERRVGDDEWNRRVRLLRREDDGRCVRSRDRHVREEERRVAFDVDQAVEGEHHVRRREGRAVGELDVGAQLERVCLGVGGCGV